MWLFLFVVVVVVVVVVFWCCCCVCFAMRFCLFFVWDLSFSWLWLLVCAFVCFIRVFVVWCVLECVVLNVLVVYFRLLRL